MGRHDIKLRRQKMTSRRIEGFKDYNSLLERHKSTRLKRLIKLLFLLLFFTALCLFAYLLISKTEKTENVKPQSGTQIISRPDVSFNSNLNTENNGKT